MNLHEVTKELGQAYSRAKEWTSAKDDLRDDFFQAVDEELSNSLPARSVIEVQAQDEEEVLRIAQRRYQRHIVIQTEEVNPGTWNLTLEENPRLKDFKYVNPEDGQVYQRIIAEGSPILDDEGLRQEDPDLWDAITEEVAERKLKSMDSLTPEQQAAIEPYVTMGKPSVRLGAPRKAKQEELND